MPSSKEILQRQIATITEAVGHNLPPLLPATSDETSDLVKAIRDMMQNYTEDRRQWNEFENFYSHTAYLSNEEETLTAGRKLIRNLLPCDGGVIQMAGDGDLLQLRVAWGADQPHEKPSSGEGTSNPREEAHHSIHDCPAVWSTKVFESIIQRQKCQCLSCPDCNYTLCSPLPSLGSPVGILRVCRLHGTPFSPLEIRLVERMTAAIGAAVSNYRLIDSVRMMALTDPLTGLYNHRFLEEVLDKSLADGERNGGIFALILLDIDFFKKLNDTYGHETGNIALREFVKVLHYSLRPSDILTRWGGEEFIALLPRADLTGALLAAERIRRNVENWETVSTDNRRVEMTVSIGVAAYPIHGRKRLELFEKADLALYEAKTNGRNQVRTIQPELGGAACTTFLGS